MEGAEELRYQQDLKRLVESEVRCMVENVVVEAKFAGEIFLLPWMQDIKKLAPLKYAAQNFEKELNQHLLQCKLQSENATTITHLTREERKPVFVCSWQQVIS